jgi:hypothetical protein
MLQTVTKTMAERVSDLRITMTAMRTTKNDVIDSMPPGSRHYRCALKRGDRMLRVVFSQGPAITTEPTAVQVLDAVAGDAAGFLNHKSFEDWTQAYGYDTESHEGRQRALKVYNAVKDQTAALATFLGVYFDLVVFRTEAM